MTRELLPKLTVLQAQCLADACRPCKRKDTGGRVEASLVRMGLAEHSGEILGHDDRVYKADRRHAARALARARRATAEGNAMTRFEAVVRMARATADLLSREDALLVADALEHHAERVLQILNNYLGAPMSDEEWARAAVAIAKRVHSEAAIPAKGGA